MEPITCVVVGDNGIGKTCMLLAQVSNRYREDYEPTVHNNYNTIVQHENKCFNLNILDTSGQEVYDRLRRLMYKQSDVILICYSVVNHRSYHNVIQKWLSEAKTYNRRAPIVLVAMQTDRRVHVDTLMSLARDELQPITVVQGIDLAREMHAAEFIECTATRPETLQLIIDAVIYAFQKRKRRRAKHKCVMC